MKDERFTFLDKGIVALTLGTISDLQLDRDI